MQKNESNLSAAQPGAVCAGFELVRKQYIASKAALLYTLRHQKTSAELLYFDRADENKTFAICFKTLPEDNTGVFHILEHSVLNGSRKYPVKEPFVSMLQSSMQTFLNALTFSDKTVYPVSSRNEQDFFNLMAVYLDAVFCPLLYERPEIFMQEGWHYEFENADAAPFYNGVVFSEMKGAFADVDSMMADETDRLLFPDTCYGFISGGHPEHIPDLTYRKFVDTHKRFYHPSNARIFLDGHMDIDAVLQYIDGAYLSNFTYRAPDFDFVPQTPQTAEKTVYYETQPGEDALAHMVIAKILCKHADVEKIYAARILADYLTGSNEAPLTRAILEKGLARDVRLEINDGVFQPSLALTLRNADPANFSAIRTFLPEAVRTICTGGLNRDALSASLERAAFQSREITEPYGVELAIRALDSWLYGGDPMTHIDNAGIYDALRAKLDTPYFTALLAEMLADPADKSCLFVLPSTTKGADDAKREAGRLAAVSSAWSAQERREIYAGFLRMQQWQQAPDSAAALSTLPHLNLADIPEEITPLKTEKLSAAGRDVLNIMTETNGIVYLNLYFDLSGFSLDELRMLSVLAVCFGQLRTEATPADVLQTRIKASMGALSARIERMARPGDLKHCTPYLLISASMLEENTAAALALLREILTAGRYDEADRIREIVLQQDYFMKQALIGSGHTFAISKALSAFSAEGALKEALEGESFVRWFSAFTEKFDADRAAQCRRLRAAAEKAFARSRLFAGCSGNLQAAALENLIQALPENETGARAPVPVYDKTACAIEIPAGVGFSAIGCNLCALGATFSGSCSVLSSLATYSYLWNAIRVQGGAYGAGMNVRANGDLFCYSYRDPNLESSRAAYLNMPAFLTDFLAQDMPLDDMIIGTVNTTDPLLDPSGICDLACSRFLKGITPQDIVRIRREILHTTAEDLRNLADILKAGLAGGKFCAVGSHSAIAFLTDSAALK